jgi:hypothetical protein
MGIYAGDGVGLRKNGVYDSTEAAVCPRRRHRSFWCIFFYSELILQVKFHILGNVRHISTKTLNDTSFHLTTYTWTTAMLVLLIITKHGAHSNNGYFTTEKADKLISYFGGARPVSDPDSYTGVLGDFIVHFPSKLW